MKIGFILNPIAGIGGPAGLKGSDGAEIQTRAMALGSEPGSLHRARQTLSALTRAETAIRWLSAGPDMGHALLTVLGFSPERCYQHARPSQARDTRDAAAAMLAAGADLLLFVGGDGTARDLLDSTQGQCPVLGIPAGVKIQSAVYAVSPSSAARVIQELNGRPRWQQSCQQREVMDLDESLLRQGKVSPRLYGYLPVPECGHRLQGAKARHPGRDEAAATAIAHYLHRQMQPDTLYVLGPGSTTYALKQCLGGGTLLGVDVYRNRQPLALDVNRRQLLALESRPPWEVMVTCIGGQGFILGRGNQQIAPELFTAPRHARLRLLATPAKLAELAGRPLLSDSGSAELDQHFNGYHRIVTGPGEETCYPVCAAHY